jgi:hypothetical protein
MVTGRPSLLVGRSRPSSGVITRSDGVNFHLVFGDGPIVYPSQGLQYLREMVSLGFWYVYHAKAAVVVVILRRPPSEDTRLLQCIEQIADALAEQLASERELPGFVEADAYELLFAAY